MVARRDVTFFVKSDIAYTVRWTRRQAGTIQDINQYYLTSDVIILPCTARPAELSKSSVFELVSWLSGAILVCCATVHIGREDPGSNPGLV